LAYSLDARGTPTSVTSEITAGQGLAFAYANATHKGRLLVFAVDEQRHVFWFHPAWQDGRENPVAVPIAQDEAIHELPRATFHQFGGSRVHLLGVFLDEALSVRDLEAKLGRNPAAALPGLAAALPRAEIVQLDVELRAP
jgi:hypothetical protein